ncbi:MAG: tRNA pseudouridine(55) synthase TruB [Chamaesiphon sp.]
MGLQLLGKNVQGFLNLNKPGGFTSHDCVAKVRRILRLKRVGHGGTLDPAATGVLPIALGKATRLLQFLPQDKAYWATIRLGQSTATDDLEGETIASQPVTELSLEAVKGALQQFRGKIQQIPPNYSAIQVQGKRLYQLARAGEQIEVQARTVEIFKIEILNWRTGDYPELDVEIACGSGTYIRALARDLGIALNTGGVLASLTRTKSCGFQLADSLTFDKLETELQQSNFHPISPATALAHLQTVHLPATVARAWCQGQRIFWDNAFAGKKQETTAPMAPEIMMQVWDEDDRFLGIAQLANSETGRLLIPQMVFEPRS